jgi:hypothetical protein
VQIERNTTSKKWQAETRLTDGESAIVTSAMAAKITGYTSTLPAQALARCYNCQAVVAVAVLASGNVVNLDLEIDEGQPRAILTSPHDCWESGDAQ